MTNVRNILSIVAFIHIEQGKLLVVRSEGKTVFYMPGGKIEPGESPKQAVIRECKEELSIDLLENSVTLYTSFQTQAYSEKHTDVDVSVFTGNFHGEILPGSEIEELRYVSAEEYFSMSEQASVTKILLHRLRDEKKVD